MPKKNLRKDNYKIIRIMQIVSLSIILLSAIGVSMLSTYLLLKFFESLYILAFIAIIVFPVYLFIGPFFCAWIVFGIYKLAQKLIVLQEFSSVTLYFLSLGFCYATLIYHILSFYISAKGIF